MSVIQLFIIRLIALMLEFLHVFLEGLILNKSLASMMCVFLGFCVVLLYIIKVFSMKIIRPLLKMSE
jgi:hypothetical protein